MKVRARIVAGAKMILKGAVRMWGGLPPHQDVFTTVSPHLTLPGRLPVLGTIYPEEEQGGL